MSEAFRTGQRQDRAPVYEALREYQRRGIVPLHTPAHKGLLRLDGLEQFLTPLGLACDLPSMDATDNWFHPRSCIAEAQRLAAELYGASESFYLVNGSTIGVQAMMLAAVSPGEKVVLSRAMHVSSFAALALSGAVPVYLPTRWLDTAGPVPPRADEIEQCLRRHPDVRAVLLTHPTSYGLGRPLGPISEVCHHHGAALLVDEAHGAHLPFLPRGSLPSAIGHGADVAVQSAHKTLGALVGSAQMHRAAGSRVSSERLRTALNLLQSTSSSYLLLASLDLTRRRMSKEGRVLFRRAVERAAVLRHELDMIPGIRALAVASSPELEGCDSDPLKLVVDGADLGLTGFQIERRLMQEFQILSEFCDTRNVAFVLGPADTEEGYRRLTEGFRGLSAARPTRAGTSVGPPCLAITPQVALTPREATFRSRERVALGRALGRICAESITVYPPGIPLICPGELFTAEVLDYCEQVAAQPACVFADDPSLATVWVLQHRV